MESQGNANDFSLPQSHDKDKTLSSQVLEYYKKYSQNRALPKYFCGTSSSSFKVEDWHELPTRKPDSIRDHATIAVNTEEICEETIKPSIAQPEPSNWTRPPLIGQDHMSEPLKPPDINVVSDHVCATSPTSSVASNRKLEWDNGADIGYNNVETHKILQKSISLPVLSNLEYGELRKNLLRLSPEGYNTESSQVQQPKQSGSEKSSDSDLISNLQSYPGTKPHAISFNPPYSSSTSESIKSSKKNYISSSSSSAGPQQKLYLSDSDSSSEAQKLSEGVLKFLKGKVGLPLAESTPIIRIDQNTEGYSETPKLIKPKESRGNFIITQNEDSTSKFSVQNIEVSATVALKEISNLGGKLSSSCENLNSPKIEEGLKKWHSQIDLNMVDQVSHYKNLKILKLCVSKPVVVECAGISNATAGKNKFIQTSLPRNASIAIQTDFDFTNCQELPSQLKKSSPKYVERQSILYIYHSDSDKERNTNSSATQTNSNALSKCNSFEYLYGPDYDRNLQKPVTEAEEDANKSPSGQIEVIPGPSNAEQDETVVMDKFLLSNLKRCPPKSDLTTLTPDSDKTVPTSDSSQTTSKDSPLAHLISSKQSGHLIPDLQNNLQLLQKVIKSRKYDNITKKHCLKKIVQKMVDSKYSDDSSESYDTSEKSDIKKSITKTSERRVYQQVNESSEISSNSNNIPVENVNKDKMNLHDNKPWLPIQQTSNKLEKSSVTEFPQRKQMQPKTLQAQTFVNEILPDNTNFQKIPTCEPSFVPYQDLKPTCSNFVPIQPIHNGKTRLQRNPLFTLTDRGLMMVDNISENHKHNHGDTSNSTANELYEVLQPTESEIATPLVSSSNSFSLKQNVPDENGSKGFQSWREDKTRSEQLLEQKANRETGDVAAEEQENKDHLLHFAKKEREHQLYWINNEISHLGKLKKLLERGEKSKKVNMDAQEKVLRTILEKPHVEDIKGRTKSTSVYIVTTERSSESSEYSTPRTRCDLRTCKNPNCRGRHVSPASTSSSNKSINIKIRGRVPSPKPNITSLPVQNTSPSFCKCNQAPCLCKPEPPTMTLRAPSLIGHGETIVNIGDEMIDLKNARLVSSEQFTTGNNGGKCRTSIRRYTFEIPVECSVENGEPVQVRNNQAGQAAKCPPQCSPKRMIKVHNTNEHVADTNKPGGSRAASPKCIDRLTHELVVTDEIVCGERRRSVSPQRCICKSSRGTSPTPPLRRVTCRCDNKTTQTSTSLLEKNCTCTSSDSSSESESSSTQLCRCCKQACADMLRARSQADNKKYAFCQPCYNQNSVKAYYTFPGHVCTCYNVVQSCTVQKMRNTIQQLENLEKEEEYCKCLYAKARSTSGYCSQCGCKLNNKYKQNKGGLAYILTLESNEKKRKKHKKKTQPVLEEIKIKVVSPASKNKHRRKLSNASSDASRCNTASGKENSSYLCEDHQKNENHKQYKCRKPTLQEYLCANKPTFIASAEQRRKCLLDLAYMREQRCQKYKQLLALTQGIPLKNNATGECADSKKQHVFSSKEMKEITAKNYKKLPEVQQKLVNNKENQIKKANKLLADIFNRKLRQQVLKGKHSLPADASIINLG